MEQTGGHLLALKVMRVSRPSLLGEWTPYAGESPHFDAHNGSSAMSMQSTPSDLSVIPSTVRDFNALGPMLSLPASFGSISLGETFASVLCVTNQTHFEVEGVHLRVEMQSTSAKSVLLELGGPDHRLGPSSTLEAVVQSEIKELGQHTLSCIVHYRVPPGLRPPAPSDDPSDPRAQLFRKHYRFPVTNPFSVKTKVHTPKSPTAVMSRLEREKVFLEVHVQNLTQEPLWFERLDFRPVDGWTSTANNSLDSATSSNRSRAFCGAGSVVQPQDTFQYVYSLTPAVIPHFPLKPVPGGVVPLGRLDMAWRSKFGEPGRLLTSMLSRRIPAAPVHQPAPSALPLHLQRAMAQIPRPQSPTASSSTSRPSSPSPYKSRQPNRPQTPVQILPNPAPALPPTDVEVDLVVDEFRETGTVKTDEAFFIHFTVTAAATVHSAKKRLLKLAAQHVVYSQAKASQKHSARLTQHRDARSSHSPTPSGTSTPRVFSMDFHPSLVTSPRKHRPARHGAKSTVTSLPSPYAPPPSDADYQASIGTGKVEFLGSSLKTLPTIEITRESITMESAQGEGPHEVKRLATARFELEFLPIKQGHANVGGVRLLLLSDEELDESEQADGRAVQSQARILQEWPIVAQVWVE